MINAHRNDVKCHKIKHSLYKDFPVANSIIILYSIAFLSSPCAHERSSIWFNPRAAMDNVQFHI